MAPRSWPATLVAALCGALALASRASAANEESAEVHRFWYNSESGETVCGRRVREKGASKGTRGKEPPPMRPTPASWRSWDLFEGFWRRAVEIIWHRDRSAWGRPWGRLPGVELGVPKEAHPRPASLVPTRVLVSRGKHAATSHEGSCPGMRQLCQVRLGTFSSVKKNSVSGVWGSSTGCEGRTQSNWVRVLGKGCTYLTRDLLLRMPIGWAGGGEPAAVEALRPQEWAGLLDGACVRACVAGALPAPGQFSPIRRSDARFRALTPGGCRSSASQRRDPVGAPHGDGMVPHRERRPRRPRVLH